MLITNVQLNITVEDLAAAEEALSFIEAFGGFIVEVRQETMAGHPGLFVDLRAPSAHIAQVLDILRADLGEVTYFNAWSADVSERYAKLLQELAEVEAALPGLSSAEADEARQRIEHLRGMIAFREEREAYDSIVLHLVEAP